MDKTKLELLHEVSIVIVISHAFWIYID